MSLPSIASLPIEERLKIAHDASGSRIYDVLLESPAVPSKFKRQFIMDLIGHYHLLVDDRIGSRVGDRCWSFADTYLKVYLNLIRNYNAYNFYTLGKDRPQSYPF